MQNGGVGSFILHPQAIRGAGLSSRIDKMKDATALCGRVSESFSGIAKGRRREN